MRLVTHQMTKLISGHKDACKSRLVLNLSQAKRIECAVRAVIKLYCTNVSCEWGVLSTLQRTDSSARPFSWDPQKAPFAKEAGVAIDHSGNATGSHTAIVLQFACATWARPPSRRHCDANPHRGQLICSHKNKTHADHRTKGCRKSCVCMKKQLTREEYLFSQTQQKEHRPSAGDSTSQCCQFRILLKPKWQARQKCYKR